jgi:hypothetical protein
MITSYNVLEDRRVVPQGECLVWTGTGTRSDGGGYGQVMIARQRYLVHRLAYEQSIGPIPEGLTIDHLCRTKRCVRPDHLEPVSSRENSLRGNNLCAQRARQTHCKRGHEFSPGNTYIVPSTGSRQCRACKGQRP